MEPAFWRKGLSFWDYLAQKDMNVPTMRENFQETEVPQEDRELFEKFGDKAGIKGIKIVAISESWCGDCVENLPVIAKLSALYASFDLRIFPRDENLEIMDLYLTDGKRTIPVFVFYDPSWKEIGRFIERPQKAHEFLERERSKLNSLSPKERERASYEIRAKMRKLYKEGLRNETIKEIRRILEPWYQGQ